ncbi:MAG: hypothetical protein ACRECY_12190 [Phyllobacterium sp.]
MAGKFPDLIDGPFRIVGKFSCSVLGPKKIRQQPLGLRRFAETGVDQNIGNARLLLYLVGERNICVIDRSDIDDQVRFGGNHRLDVALPPLPVNRP